MTRKAGVIEVKKVNDIQLMPYNPEGRLHDSSYKILKAEIEDAGKIRQPLMMSIEDDQLADGYRRLSIAKELGWKEVRVIYEHGRAIDLWRSQNTGVRKMGSLDVFQAIVMHGAPLEMIPKYFQYPIERLIDLVGIDLAREIAEKGYTPHIVETIALIMRYCQRKDDPEFAQFVARWLIDQRQNYAVRKSIESKIPCEDILTAINENKKLVRTWKLE